MLKKHIKNTKIVVAGLSAEYPGNYSDFELQKFKIDHFKGKNFSKHVGYTGYLTL